MKFQMGFTAFFTALLTAGCASTGTANPQSPSSSAGSTTLPSYCIESECSQPALAAIAEAKKLVLKKLNSSGDVAFDSILLNTGKQDGIAMICGNVTVSDKKTIPVPVSNRFIARANGTAIVLDREVLDFHLTWSRFCEKEEHASH